MEAADGGDGLEAYAERTAPGAPAALALSPAPTWLAALLELEPAPPPEPPRRPRTEDPRARPRGVLPAWAEGDTLLSADAVARTLGCCRRQVWYLARTRGFPTRVRIGRSARWKLDEILLYIERRRRKDAP